MYCHATGGKPLIISGMFSFVTGKGKVRASWVEGGVIALLRLLELLELLFPPALSPTRLPDSNQRPAVFAFRHPWRVETNHAVRSLPLTHLAKTRTRRQDRLRRLRLIPIVLRSGFGARTCPGDRLE